MTMREDQEQLVAAAAIEEQQQPSDSPQQARGGVRAWNRRGVRQQHPWRRDTVRRHWPRRPRQHAATSSRARSQKQLLPALDTVQEQQHQSFSHPNATIHEEEDDPRFQEDDDDDDDDADDISVGVVDPKMRLVHDLSLRLSTMYMADQVCIESCGVGTGPQRRRVDVDLIKHKEHMDRTLEEFRSSLRMLNYDDNDDEKEEEKMGDYEASPFDEGDADEKPTTSAVAAVAVPVNLCKEVHSSVSAFEAILCRQKEQEENFGLNRSSDYDEYTEYTLDTKRIDSNNDDYSEYTIESQAFAAIAAAFRSPPPQTTQYQDEYSEYTYEGTIAGTIAAPQPEANDDESGDEGSECDCSSSSLNEKEGDEEDKSTQDESIAYPIITIPNGALDQDYSEQHMHDEQDGGDHRDDLTVTTYRQFSTQYIPSETTSLHQISCKMTDGPYTAAKTVAMTCDEDGQQQETASSCSSDANHSSFQQSYSNQQQQGQRERQQQQHRSLTLAQNSRLVDLLRVDLHHEDASMVHAALQELAPFDASPELLRYGGVLVLLRTAQLYPDNADIQLAVCRRLYSIARAHPVARETMRDMGGLVDFLDMLQSHSDHAPLNRVVCAILADMTQGWVEEADKQTESVLDDAIAVLAGAMARHSRDVVVQQHAFTALAHVCSDNSARTQELSRSGALSAMTMALQTPWQDAAAQHEAIATLSILLRSLANVRHN